MGKGADCDRYNLQQPVHPSRQDCLCRSLRKNGARSPCFHLLTSRSLLTQLAGSPPVHAFITSLLLRFGTRHRTISLTRQRVDPCMTSDDLFDGGSIRATTIE